MNRNQKDAIIAVLCGALVELVIVAASVAIPARPDTVQTLVLLSAVQSIGGGVAEHLYPHVGYGAAFVA